MEEVVASTMRSRLNEPESIAFINEQLISNPKLKKIALAKLLCEKFLFIAANGELQIASCIVVLNNLSKHEKILLPKLVTKDKAKFVSMRLSGNNYPIPMNFPKTVHEIKNEIEIILIEREDKAQKLIWNDLIAIEHPQEDSKIVGYQVKYLIKYQGFYIGAASFSSSALNLEARDKWLGWTKEQKIKYQNKIIGMSRFLIRNEIHCENLASHLLSKLITRIKVDFLKRYNIGIWILESFVDTESYIGTCYKAANWVCLGQSKGRGRNDILKEKSKSIKDIYVYVLEPSFREICYIKPTIELYQPMNIETGITSLGWSEHEFGGIDLGNKRLTQRVIKIAKDKGEDPTASYAKAVKGESKDILSYYKLLENDSEKITPEEILSNHKKNTICKMAAYPKSLVLHDDSRLNYSGLLETKGLGHIGKNKNSKGSRGLLTHTRLAINLEGLPMGVLSSPCSAPEFHEDKSEIKKDRPIEEKESLRWLQGYQDDIEISKRLPIDNQVVSVMDREGDICDIFKLADINRKRNPVVIRSQHNRRLIGINTKLHETMENAPINFTEVVEIPSQRSREKTNNKPARPYIKGRDATLSVTYQKVTIKPREHKWLKNQKPIELYAVYARELNPPEGAERIEWLLLTTLEITNQEAALECISIYKQRWKIEDFFRVLKSGCKIEMHKLDDAKKLERIIAISVVIAWRIMLLTLLGRKCPELPPECFFSEDEILAMELHSKKKLQA